MNAVDEQIRFYAKQLKIPSFAEYQEVLRQTEPSAGFGDLLLELMKAETASRQENQNRRRLKAAGFPYLKTMEEFDCSQLNDAVSHLFLQELASCQFVQNKQNVIMIGNPGRGKTHLSIALGLKACTRGYNVLFKNAATLSTELCEAKDNYHLGKLERTLAKADLLILDELSYLSFNRHQSDGVLATPFRCVAFHDTPLYAEKPPYRFHPYGGRRFICRTSRCATRCGPASEPAHHPRCGK